MNQKIISIKHRGSDYFYSHLSLEDIAKECDDSEEETTFAGMYYKGKIIFGLDDEFFHCYLEAIYEEIMNEEVIKEEALFFVLFYSKEFINANGKDSFQDKGGYLLENDSWGLWFTASENSKRSDFSQLTTQESNQIIEGFESSPTFIYVER